MGSLLVNNAIGLPLGRASVSPSASGSAAPSQGARSFCGDASQVGHQPRFTLASATSCDLNSLQVPGLETIPTAHIQGQNTQGGTLVRGTVVRGTKA